MKPNIQILYKYEYAKRLYQGKEHFEDVWRRILGLGADFEDVAEEYIDVVLDSIKKYSGFTWDEFGELHLQVYLIEADKSLAHPLSLAVNEDPETMLEDFVYQLAHRNILFGFKDDNLQKQCLQSVTNHVMIDLNLRKLPDSQLDLRQQTIKKYLGK